MLDIMILVKGLYTVSDIGMVVVCREEEYGVVVKSVMDPDDYYLSTVDDSIDAMSPGAPNSQQDVQNLSEGVAVDDCKVPPDYLLITNSKATRHSSIPNISSRVHPITPSHQAEETDWPYDNVDSKFIKSSDMRFDHQRKQSIMRVVSLLEYTREEQAKGSITVPNIGEATREDDDSNKTQRPGL